MNVMLSPSCYINKLYKETHILPVSSPKETVFSSSIDDDEKILTLINICLLHKQII